MCTSIYIYSTITILYMRYLLKDLSYMMNKIVLAVAHQYLHIDTKIRTLMVNLCHLD